MLKIIICEDDKCTQEELSQIIRQLPSGSTEEFVFEYKEQENKIQTSGYLLNSVTPKLLQNMLSVYQKARMSNEIQYIQVRKLDRTERIFLKHVRYFVSDRRKIKAVFDQGQEPVEFYMKMADVEEHLKNTGFLRCHQSYLVNVHHILYWDGSNIMLTSNEKIPISRKYKKELFNKLNELTDEIL